MKPTRTIVGCESTNVAHTDVTFQHAGILKLDYKCKCYTAWTIPVASSKYSSNFSNFISTVDLNTDDCCIQPINVIHHVETMCVNLKILNVHQLEHAHLKLIQFDEII